MHVVVDTAQSVLAAGRLEIGFGFGQQKEMRS